MCELKTINCAKCGIAFCLPAEVEKRYRRSHEEFFCPSGHTNYFPGKTAEEKKIENLERNIELWREEAEYFRRERDARTMDAVEALRACPLGCGWHSPRHIREAYNFEYGFVDRVRESVALHLAEVHGAEVLEAVSQEESLV